jgi:hypothetical protein
MSLQKAQIGKTAIILVIIMLLVTLAAIPLFLQADSTGEATSEANVFLPVVYNEDDGTPNPVASATPTPTSSHTPTATDTATNAPTDVPTATNTPVTPLPAPADLIVGPPILISTPPIIVYEPVAFQVPVTNTGDIAIVDLFFVDLLFDPTPVHYSDVYAAVSGLGGNNSITLTITSTIGFANFVGTHQVTGWVDSLDHIVEANETNNFSEPLDVPIASFGGTPTSTPIPNGTATISGAARVFVGGSFINQERMLVSAIDETSGLTVAVTYSDENGFYQFDNLMNGTSYTVTGCITIDNNEYFGIRTNRVAPDAFSDIFAMQGTCQ